MAFSPSGLAQFCTCPRQFLYQRVLRLPEGEKSISTRAGSLVHKLLEILNRHYPHAYTLETLQTLAQGFFELQTLDATWGALGVTPQDMALLVELGPVSRAQVLKSTLVAFENLAESGYFDLPFARLHPEVPVALDGVLGMSGVRLQGRIDLIRERPDGSLEIIDYKTARSAKQKAVLTSIEAFLAPYPEDLPWFPGYFENRHMQLPLYWWVLTQLPAYQGRTVDITIQPVRPAGWGKNKVTCQPVTVPHARLLEAQENLETTLRQGILTPMMTTEQFSTEGVNSQTCQTCAFSAMCEGPTEGDLDFGTAPDPGDD